MKLWTGTADCAIAALQQQKQSDALCAIMTILAVLAFMGINGYRAKSSPGEITQWFARVSGSKPGTDAIAEIAIPDEDAHHGQNPDVRLVVNNLLANYATSIETLGSSAVAG